MKRLGNVRDSQGINRNFKKSIYINNVKKILLAVFLFCTQITTGYTDDSEVFFLKDQKTNTNILFLLDFSSSMGAVPASGGNKRKVTILQDAMQIIMFDKTLKNVNVGASTFTNRIAQNGKSLLTPILDIDDKTDFFDVATYYENNSSSLYFPIVSNKYVKEIPLFTNYHSALLVDNPRGWRSRYVFAVPPYGSLLSINCSWYMAAQGGSDSSGAPIYAPYVNCVPKKSTWKDDNAYLGYYFDNITLTSEAKNPGAILKIAVAKLPNMANYPNDYIKVASNSLLANTYGQEFELLTPNDGEQIIDIYLDKNPLPEFFKTYADSTVISSRVSDDFHTTCTVPVQNGELKPIYCDISALIAKKVKQVDWQSSNGIVVLVRPRNENLVIFTDSVYNKIPTVQTPKLYITASTKDSFKDKEYPQRRAVLASFINVVQAGGTGIVETMLASAQYISNIPKKTITGPYHSFVSPSPFSTDSIANICQTTYLALMTDGVATYNSTVEAQKKLVQNYMGSNSCSFELGSTNGGVVQNDSGENGEACGRALAYWLANNTHTIVSDANIKTENVIRIKGIGFDLDGVENGNGNQAASFINDLTRISGGGNSAYKADNAEELVAAFKDILSSASEPVSPTSGQVAASGQNRFKQRKEAFYTFYQAANRDYWLGNMKGYFIDYVKAPNGKLRPVLYGKDKKTPAIIAEENNGIISTRFAESVSTLWSNKDGSIISSGGILGQIIPTNSDPVLAIENRKSKMRFLDTSSNLIKDLDDLINYSFAQKDKSDLLLDEKKALIDYMQGYNYQLGGVTSPTTTDVVKPVKIGDSARSNVTLVNYGCSGSSSAAKFEDCPQTQLKQLALLASNDGFFRGFTTSNGATSFEILPQEMSSNLEQLYISAPVDGQTIRTYGLDGTVAVYHNDANQNDYVDNGEPAYAYVSSGRGGSAIYAFDITRFGRIPTPVWSINNSKIGFTDLGKTWSTPVTGKLLNDTPVIIFGGGEAYDSYSGKGIYIVAAYTGKLLKYINTEGSVPSTVSILKNNNDQIQDIFVGDTKGNVYRIHASFDNSVLFESEKIASFGSDKKFYHAPSIYKLKNKNVFSINIGSGDRNTPLSIDNDDNFYSFHIPLEFTSSVSNNYITEQMLPEAFTSEDLTEGFKITFKQKGEKVISDYVADLGQLVFNTYVPPDYSSNQYNCSVKTGQQNSYYIDLSTGKSLITSEYISTDITGLPSSVSLMSDGRYVSFVASTSSLAEDLPNETEIQKTIVDLCNGGGCWIKTSWTDMFDIDF